MKAVVRPRIDLGTVSPRRARSSTPSAAPTTGERHGRARPGPHERPRGSYPPNGEPIPFFDFVRKVLRGAGLPEPRGRVPYAIAYGVAALAEAAEVLKGGAAGAEDGMSRFAIRYLCTHHWFAIEKARRDLGYRPAVSIDGLRRRST